jgi:hypothetical protein
VRAKVVALAIAAIVGVGCGSARGPTCAELREQPGRYGTEAAKLAKPEVGDLPAWDCDATCKRNFTTGIERDLRKGCRGATDGHRPEEAVIDRLHSD